MDILIIFSIVSTIIMVFAYFPYFRDISLRRTKPHAYTWLIWILTQGTALAGMWYWGASWGLLSLAVATLLVAVVFLVSLKYGTKNITKEDTVILIFAILAILVWWQLDKPLLSVIMVTIIDVAGYIPTLRKSYLDPWSETLFTWFLFILSNILAILSINQYNLMTTLYISAITLANLFLLLFCFMRRKVVRKPRSFR